MDIGYGKSDTIPLAVACAAAVAATIVLAALGSDAYVSVLGMAHPVGPVMIVMVLGFVGWLILSRRFWVSGWTGGGTGYGLAVLIGLTLPVPVIIVDCLGGFGRGINAPAPDSLLFYPSIALVAEFVFHIAPLAVAGALASWFRRAERALALCGLGAAVAIEPIVQALWGAEGAPIWVHSYVGVHLLGFNAFGMYLLRRFGILRALVCRLSYYLVWHVLWGHLRLGLLFAG